MLICGVGVLRWGVKFEVLGLETCGGVWVMPESAVGAHLSNMFTGLEHLVNSYFLGFMSVSGIHFFQNSRLGPIITAHRVNACRSRRERR